MTSNPTDFARMYGGTLVTTKGGKVLTTSLKVAEVFDKKHYNILKAVDALECSQGFRDVNFYVSSYRPQGAKRSYPMVEMTRDGFSMLVFGFTGKKADLWKEQFINAFNLMEQRLGQIDPDFAALSSQIAALTGMVQGIADQNQAMKPKAALAEAITQDMTLFKLSTIADELGMSGIALGQRLCGWLLTGKWVGLQWRNIPTEKTLKDGFAVKVGPETGHNYRFTAKGRDLIRARYAKEAA
ncbi:MAG: Rha family transcriptional regulator [Pseudodesulfovibrio sp.]|uniref:Rha family transcriptional regulator n=1 Tax=Pseudodesulfovibrio sp. TaxID=2035812 RepID=UPI003D0EB682